MLKRTKILASLLFVLAATMQWTAFAAAPESPVTKPTYRAISARELHNLIDENKRPITIVDVGGIESWARAHIPGATSADVSTEPFPFSKMSLIAVYNSAFGSKPARDFAQRLIAAEYPDVVVIPGGIAEWEAGRYPIEGMASPNAVILPPLRAETVKSAIDLKDAFRLIDVRGHDTFAKERIVGAANARPNAVTQGVGDAAKTDWVILYDANDRLADVVAFELRRLGFKRVTFIDGGFPALIAAGAPTVRGKPASEASATSSPASEPQTKRTKPKSAKGAEARSGTATKKPQKKVPSEQSR